MTNFLFENCVQKAKLVKTEKSIFLYISFPNMVWSHPPISLSYKFIWKKILGGQALDWFSYLHRSLEVRKNLGSTSGEVGNRGSPQCFCKVGF